MADFTDSAVFADFFGTFWNRSFSDPEFIHGIAGGEAQLVAQNYQNFVEAVNALSLNTISPFHRELVYPIVLRRSSFSQGPDHLVFGGGQKFGPQPPNTKFQAGAVFSYGGLERRSGLYYIGLPEQVRQIGWSIINKLLDPTVMLAQGSDFLVQDEVLTFKQDPFENPLIAKRIVANPETGNSEEEIVLWATNADFDRFSLYRQFGFAVSKLTASSQSYKDALRAIFAAYTGGPTLHLMESLVASLAQAPIAKHGQEIVESIEAFGAENLMVTNLSVYKIPGNLHIRPDIKVGTVLWAGQPLTTATQVFDRASNGNWWTSIPSITLGPELIVADIQSGLNFVNQPTPLELGETEAAENGESGRTARFYLAGLPDDVSRFWSNVRQFSLKSGQFLGNLLYQKYKLTDSNGSADFEKSLYVNPMELLATDLLADSLVFVKVRVTDFDQGNALFQNLRMLREVLPAYLGLMILVDVNLQDQVSFQRAEGGVEPLTLDLVNTAALLRGEVEGFAPTTKALWQNKDAAGIPLTQTPEALSCDLSPDILRQTLDLGTPANNVAAYGEEMSVCDEIITSKLEEACTP